MTGCPALDGRASFFTATFPRPGIDLTFNANRASPASSTVRDVPVNLRGVGAPHPAGTTGSFLMYTVPWNRLRTSAEPSVTSTT